MNDGYTDLPPGKLANVVTYLEMRTPAASVSATMSDFAIRREEKADLDWYRNLFREIGGPWLWVSRLRMSDDELRALLHNPDIDIFVLSHNGVAGGLLEFDRRKMPDIEILYFGVTSSLFGKGAGRAMLEHCLPREMGAQPESHLAAHLHGSIILGRWGSIVRSWLRTIQARD